MLPEIVGMSEKTNCLRIVITGILSVIRGRMTRCRLLLAAEFASSYVFVT